MNLTSNASKGYFYWKSGGGSRDTNVDFMQRHTYKQDKNVCYVDGVEVGSFTYSSWSIDYSLFLFGRSNASGVLNDASPCRIYSCKMWNNGELIRNFVPCYNKELEQYGLYDTVTEEFYGNAGSGKFLGKTFVEEGETCKVFDYEQYFIDHEMVGDISTTTITGTGTSDDPYIINSSEDFWWMSKYRMQWNGPKNLYVELGCDIALNEEKFDEDGNVIAGTLSDGRVYNWWDTGNSTLNFDGKEHSISGLYYVRNYALRGLFENTKELRNLYMQDFYCKLGYYCAPICYTAEKVINCHTLSGVMTSFSSTASLLVYSCEYVEKCSNYVSNTYDFWSLAGIVYEGGTVIDCVNYGDLFSSTYVSGITNQATLIKNCTNYGKIKARSYSGGITGFSYGVDCVIDGCKNYGENQASGSGGILGAVYPRKTNVIMRNCEVDCKVFGGGTLVGTLESMNSLTVENCKIKSYGQWVIGGSKANYIMKNCEIEMEEFEGTLLRFNFAVINTKIKVKKRSGWTSNKLYLSQNSKEANLKNVYIETDFDLDSPTNLFATKNGSPICFDGVIIKTPNSRSYYGSDFSGFNVSWKTGAISLNSMSNIGSFAPRLTEEILQGMHYTKQTL